MWVTGNPTLSLFRGPYVHVNGVQRNEHQEGWIEKEEERKGGWLNGGGGV